jgi:hypothetical protein
MHMTSYDLNETPRIETMYVSEVVDLSFSDAAEALAAQAGQTIVAGAERLAIDQLDSAPTPYQRVAGVLHVRGILPRSVHVDVVLAPWSDHRTEIGMAPRGRHMPLLPSAATDRYLHAARATIEQLATQLVQADDSAEWADRKSA